MAFPIKFLSLRETELRYEVRIRGTTPGTTYTELRRQIVELATLFPSEHILESGLELDEDIKGINGVLDKIQLAFESPLNDVLLLKVENLLNHLYHRCTRIPRSDNTKDFLQSTSVQFKLYVGYVQALKQCGLFEVDHLTCSAAQRKLQNIVLSFPRITLPVVNCDQVIPPKPVSQDSVINKDLKVEVIDSPELEVIDTSLNSCIGCESLQGETLGVQSSSKPISICQDLVIPKLIVLQPAVSLQSFCSSAGIVQDLVIPEPFISQPSVCVNKDPLYNKNVSDFNNLKVMKCCNLNKHFIMKCSIGPINRYDSINLDSFVENHFLPYKSRLK